VALSHCWSCDVWSEMPSASKSLGMAVKASWRGTAQSILVGNPSRLLQKKVWRILILMNENSQHKHDW